MLQKPRSLAIGTAKKYRNLGDLGEHGWFGEKPKTLGFNMKSDLFFSSHRATKE